MVDIDAGLVPFAETPQQGYILAHPIEQDFEFPIDARRYETNDYSVVWDMVYKLNKALPVVVKSVLDGPDVRREVAIHRAVAESHHPNILPLLAVYANMLPEGHCLRPAAALHSPGPVRVLILVTPRMASDMCEHLTVHITAGVPVTRPQLAAFVQDMVAALGHVHACNYTHADVKLENFFLSPPDPFDGGRQRVVLGDFGHAGATGSVPTRYAFGTPLYRAPEGFASHASKAAGGLHKPLHPSLDVWALGIATLVLVRVVDLPTKCVLPFGKNVAQELYSRPTWDAIFAQLRKRDTADLPGVEAFVRAALAWNADARPDTAVLPMHLL